MGIELVFWRKIVNWKELCVKPNETEPRRQDAQNAECLVMTVETMERSNPKDTQHYFA